MATSIPGAQARRDSSATDLSTSPAETRRRLGSSGSKSDILTADHYKETGMKLTVAKGIKSLKWHITKSPGKIDTLDSPDILPSLLVTPPVRMITLVMPVGMSIQVRNTKTGVTVKDAFDAIYKKYKNKEEDEVPEGVLQNFIWDPEDIGNKTWGEVGVLLSNK